MGCLGAVAHQVRAVRCTGPVPPGAGPAFRDGRRAAGDGGGRGEAGCRPRRVRDEANADAVGPSALGSARSWDPPEPTAAW